MTQPIDRSATPPDHAERSSHSYFPSLWKVAKVALIILGLFSGAARAESPIAYCNSDGVCDLQGRASLEPIAQFPPFYQYVYHPGLLSTFDGKSYCRIEGKIPDPAVCDSFAHSSEALVRQMASPEDLAYAYNSHAFAEKGTPALRVEPNEVVQQPIVLHDLDSGIGGTHVGVNSQKLANHRAVIQFVEESFLGDPDFFEKSPEDLISTIKNSHRLLANKLPSQNREPINGGIFREKEIVVKDENDHGEDQAIQIMKQNGASDEDIKAHFAFIKRFNPDDLLHLSKEERRLLELRFHIMLPAREISARMKAFAEEFIQRGRGLDNGTEDPVEMAAWTHQQLSSIIHPFNDSNGRLSRTWMNAVLLRGGYRAVIFPDDAVYTQAIQDDWSARRPFAAFLREMISWNAKQPPMEMRQYELEEGHLDPKMRRKGERRFQEALEDWKARVNSAFGMVVI